MTYSPTGPPHSPSSSRVWSPESVENFPRPNQHSLLLKPGQIQLILPLNNNNNNSTLGAVGTEAIVSRGKVARQCGGCQGLEMVVRRGLGDFVRSVYCVTRAGVAYASKIFDIRLHWNF